MTWFALTFSTIMTVFIAALLYWMPSITHSTLPLGVSVPQSHVHDPVITSAERKYRLGVVASFLVSVAIAVALSAFSPAAGVIVPTLVMLALGMTSYIATRTAIMRAKKDGQWYENVPVRLSAHVTATRPAATMSIVWYLTALVPLAIATGIGVGEYPALPNPLPIHWGFDGIANGFADKSIWSAFGILMIGFGMLVLLFAVSFRTRVSPSRRVASDSPETAHHRASVQRRLMSSLLGQIALIMMLDFGAIAVISWLAPKTAWLSITPLILLLLLIAGAIAAYFVRYRRSMARQPDTVASPATTSSAQAHAAAPRPDAPDDDRYWKGGVFYVNRRDPSLLVPKRFGVGWTLNLGHPAGIAIGVVLLLIIAGGIVLATLSPGSHH